LSNIIDEFNRRFGDIEWNDSDQVMRTITVDLPAIVSSDKAYQNAMSNPDEQNAKIEHDRVLDQAIINLVTDNTQLYKNICDNAEFKKFIYDVIFKLTYPQHKQSLGQL
jgi:type I restriction enzyme R subunit